ncbi:MAG: methionine ABC transporter ATP-binding protein [Acholeplasmataceae bacterium]|jgi:D-methionine transport system ATP-binding protein|nr:methionine ABC transporter ATP-binding protein [Acholeplasmataceae bacterium]
MIEIKNLSKTIDNLSIVSGVNLTIKAGTKLGIVGESGAGKSSLIRMINHLMIPSTGKVIIDGVDIASQNTSQLQKIRRNIAMIFQHFNLLDQKNVYDNVKLSLTIANYPKAEIDSRIKELLTLVGLTAKTKAYPRTLSGGEKQRVAIARALANNPKYLLCDEPTSALDLKTSFEILDLLHTINELYGVTIILVSHDLDAVKYLCDQVAVMHQGRIIEHQSTIELFLKPKSDLTKQLINRKMYDFAKGSQEEIYQVAYLDDLANKPVISLATKMFNVEINIIYAEVININRQNIGFLYINIIGKDKLAAIKYLKEEVRIDKYV